MCENITEQLVPSGYDYKAVKIKCGMTGYYGEPVYCEECENNPPITIRDKYPEMAEPYDEYDY